MRLSTVSCSPLHFRVRLRRLGAYPDPVSAFVDITTRHSNINTKHNALKNKPSDNAVMTSNSLMVSSVNTFNTLWTLLSQVK